MPKFMRKHATSWFIKIALGLIIVVFIFWGVGGFRGDQGAVVAKVGNTVIDVRSYREAYQKMVEFYRKQYKGQWNEQMLKLLDIKHRVLNQLVDQVLIDQEAKRLHITVSKQELAQSIESMPAFQRNGHFSRRLYLDLLRYNRIEPADFEASKMRELLYEKVKSLVADPASFVTDAELNRLLTLQFEKRRLAYVKISSKVFLDQLKVTNEDLKKYYEALGHDVGDENWEKISHAFINEYEERKFEQTLYPDSKYVLDEISKMGISQSVLSAYSQHTLEKLIEHFGLIKYFVRLIGLDNIYAASKLENGIKWMKELGYGKGDVLLVGDTIHDCEVANEIGADPVLLSVGHQSKEKLETCGVPMINSLSELIG